MGSVNRAYLRNLARLYADGRPGGSGAFIPDSDASTNAVSFDTLVNGAIAEWYDLLVSMRGHEYYASDATLAIVAGTSQYALPSDFYQLLSIRLEWSAGQFEELEPMGVRERTYIENAGAAGVTFRRCYRLRGTQAATARIVEILPTPGSSVTGRIRYVPTCALLTDDTTTIDDVNNWSKLIALTAAIEYRTIAEKPIGNLQRIHDECVARIHALADQRNANFAEQIQQVYPERRREWWQGGSAAGSSASSSGSGGGSSSSSGGIFDGSFDGSFN
jgi:uncharacterized membrane protein YgcG